jgi:CRP-like cAMP-binding protein
MTDLFSGLSLENLAQIADICKEALFDEGQVVFKENDPAESFYIVVDGQISISTQIHRRRYDIETVGNGEGFGWASLYEASARINRAQALGSTKCLEVEAAALLMVSIDHPVSYYRFLAKMGAIVAHRYQQLLTQLR